MLKAASVAAVTVMATAQSCFGPPPKPIYDADPVGGQERCFTIDREYKDDSEREVSLGQFCKR